MVQSPFRLNNLVMNVEQRSNREIEDPRQGDIGVLRIRQMELLEIPGVPGLSVSSINWPADRITGDGYGIIPKRNPGLFIFDVTDHGLSTAMDWSMVNTALNIFSRMDYSPLEVMHHAEHHLQKISGENYVPVTALYGEINLTKGTLEYVHAGHVKPLIYSHLAQKLVFDADITENSNSGGNGRAINTGTADQPADNVPEDLNYYGHKTAIAPGDAIILYTDGVIEGRNRHGHSLGEDKFKNVVEVVISSAGSPLTAGNITKGIETALKDFYEGAQLDDDCSVMAVVIAGPTNIL